MFYHNLNLWTKIFGEQTIFSIVLKEITKNQIESDFIQISMVL